MAIEFLLRAACRRLARLIAALCVPASLRLLPGVAAALVNTAAGLLVTVLGYLGKPHLVFACGLITFLAGIAWRSYAAFAVFDVGSSSDWRDRHCRRVPRSLIERHGAIVKARLGE